VVGKGGAWHRRGGAGGVGGKPFVTLARGVCTTQQTTLKWHTTTPSAHQNPRRMVGEKSVVVQKVGCVWCVQPVGGVQHVQAVCKLNPCKEQTSSAKV